MPYLPALIIQPYCDNTVKFRFLHVASLPGIRKVLLLFQKKKSDSLAPLPQSMPQKSSNSGMLFFYRAGRQHRVYPVLQFPDVFFKAFDIPVPLDQSRGVFQPLQGHHLVPFLQLLH